MGHSQSSSEFTRGSARIGGVSGMDHGLSVSSRPVNLNQFGAKAMGQASDSMTAEVAENPTRSRGTGWACSLILGFVVVLVYLANPRDLSTYDTAATTMMTLTLVRGEGVYLDRFRPILLRELPASSRSLWCHRMAICCRVIPLPRRFWSCPWSRPRLRAWTDTYRAGIMIPGSRSCHFPCMTKRSMAVLMALTAVILHRYLIGSRIGTRGVARNAGRGTRFKPLDRGQPGDVATRSCGIRTRCGDRNACIPRPRRGGGWSWLGWPVRCYSRPG